MTSSYKRKITKYAMASISSNVAQRPLAQALTASVLFGAAALLYGRFIGEQSIVRAATWIASTGYVVLALVLEGRRTRYGRLLLVGLAWCWIGDIVGPGHFLVGVWAFLAAHVAFSLACLTRPLSRTRLGLGALGVSVASILVMRIVYPHVPESERVTILAYVAVIGVMLTLAAGASCGARRLLLAALVFYVSDVFVARWRYGGGPVNGYLCYPLYYTACTLFAWTVLPQKGSEGRAGANPAARPNASAMPFE